MYFTICNYILVTKSETEYIMSKQDKRIKKLLSIPKDLEIKEVTSMMKKFGFEVSETKSGSGHFKFIHKEKGLIHCAYRPHPHNNLSEDYIKGLITFLKDNGFIYE